MFEPKNSTRFGRIYKSDCSDILYQNFSCKTRGIIKKIRIEDRPRPGISGPVTVTDPAIRTKNKAQPTQSPFFL